jgi:hypothetical protein
MDDSHRVRLATPTIAVEIIFLANAASNTANKFVCAKQ